jgi:hypothetical protein
VADGVISAAHAGQAHDDQAGERRGFKKPPLGGCIWATNRSVGSTAAARMKRANGLTGLW